MDRAWSAIATIARWEVFSTVPLIGESEVFGVGSDATRSTSAITAARTTVSVALVERHEPTEEARKVAGGIPDEIVANMGAEANQPARQYQCYEGARS